MLPKVRSQVRIAANAFAIDPGLRGGSDAMLFFESIRFSSRGEMTVIDCIALAFQQPFCLEP